MKKLSLFTIGLLLLNSVLAQIPQGYYSNATGLSEDDLISALHNIIDDHTVKPYGDARYILDEADQDPENSSNIILIYTGSSISSNWDAGESWDREHVWSKSHGFPDENADIPYSDLHNLKPSYPDVNQARSDKDFEEGGSQHSIATECNYTSDTWEPRDEVKGDVARIMLYMVIRYNGDETGEPDLELVDNITTYPNPEFGILSTLLKWHYEDPVDDFERNRNDVIYSHQNNRNPFIDHPEYVSKIWGGGASNPAPTISYGFNTPEIPSSTETVSISATITDDGIITEAKMNWGLISGALINTITCTNTSGDLYTTDSEIPAQTDGTIVYYEIEATDDSSGVSISEEFSYEIDNNPPTEILNEDFTSCPAAGWTSYNVSGSEDWECENGYLYINAYDGTGASDDWFISPSMDLDLYIDEYLTFSSWTNYSDTYSPTIELKYSIDYSGNGDPSAANWIDLSATWPNTNSQTWTESGEIDLSGVSGTNVYIAFRYTSSGNASGTSSIWEIDNIFLTETVNILPVISEISNSPVAPDAGEDVTVVATITDSDGTVSSANILWGTTSGTYPNSISMSNTTDDSYSGIIPSQVDGTFVYYIIEATDNSAEVRQSREYLYSYNTTGNSVPTITNIAFTPEIPRSTDGVTVSATINDTDDGTISLAQMKWGTTSGNYEYIVELTNTDDTYSGYIPARPEDTEIYFVIYTSDNNGGATLSSENSYIVNDPPEISEVDISPDAPNESESVTVSASVIDANGSVTSVVLKWKTETSDYTNVNMNYSSDKYSGIIPAQAAGENISFLIEATDNLGAVSSYTYGQYEISVPNSILDIYNNRVSMYPIPASEILNIEVPDYIGAMSIQIYNIIGSQVYNENSVFNRSKEISISHLESGIYFIKINFDNENYTRKILIKNQ